MTIDEIYNLDSAIRRFWAKVDKTGDCWVWTGMLHTSGYGLLSIATKSAKPRWGVMRAHRLSYLLDRGVIDDALYICHSCDNRPCVRPDHLWEGTQRENIQDAMAKNRLSMSQLEKAWRMTGAAKSHPGEAHGNAKLTDALVREICARRASGETTVALARIYGVSQGLISHVTIGRAWRHITASAVDQ